jgi:hypothetical protein
MMGGNHQHNTEFFLAESYLRWEVPPPRLLPELRLPPELRPPPELRLPELRLPPLDLEREPLRPTEPELFVPELLPVPDLGFTEPLEFRVAVDPF